MLSSKLLLSVLLFLSQDHRESSLFVNGFQIQTQHQNTAFTTRNTNANNLRSNNHNLPKTTTSRYVQSEETKETERKNAFLLQIDNVAQQAQQAIKQAEEETKAPIPPTTPPPKPSTVIQSSDPIIAGIGGLLIGTLTGSIIDIYAIISDDLDVDPGVPPLLLAFTLGTSGFVFGSKDNPIGSAVRLVLGGPLKAIGNSIQSSATDAVDNIQTSATNAVDSAVEEVKSIPTNLLIEVDKKTRVKERKEEIMNKVDEKKAEIDNKVDDIKNKARESAEKVSNMFKGGGK